MYIGTRTPIQACNSLQHYLHIAFPFFRIYIYIYIIIDMYNVCVYVSVWISKSPLKYDFSR